MKEFNSIAVGIDYSAPSASALREASRIANWNDAKLTCFHIFDEEIVDEFRSQDGFDEAAVTATALQHLEKFVADEVGAGHDIQCQIAVGHPFKLILSTVEACEADLLVMGTHGMETKVAERTGVLASRCARKAPVDVLLVRERENEPFRSILACVDFSDNSIKAAHHAAAIAVQDNAALELLHVYRSPVYSAPDAGIFGTMLPPIDTRGMLAALVLKLDTLSEELSNLHGGLDIRATVKESAAVSHEIINHLKEVDADLAVLGTRGRTALQGFFAGTTAEKIIHKSPCSALMVKPEGFGFQLKS